MMRAAIYARYSSALQSAASIEDQVEVCRRYIEQQGWTLAKVYADRAASGGSAFRDGYQQLLVELETVSTAEQNQSRGRRPSWHRRSRNSRRAHARP